MDYYRSMRLYRNSIIIVVLLALFIVPFKVPHPALAHTLTHTDLDLASYVNPFIGTSASPWSPYPDNSAGGNVFPGAVFPRGMVQWSPDTTGLAGGYRYTQSVIHGFSLTHFSGRGCTSYQDFPFMPTTGSIVISPENTSLYSSTYSHDNESASPGYYSVHLDSSNINVELTATPRSGLGRFTYPPTPAADMLISAGDSAAGNSDAGTGIHIVGDSQVVGSASSGHFCGMANTYTVYFAATFDHPFSGFGAWHGSTVNPNSRSSSGKESGAYVTFDTTQNPVVLVKVGLSFVSIANAQANLAREDPRWNFEAVRQSTRSAWDNALSTIQVNGGSDAEREIFYTALYHTFIHPNIFSDVNGEYIGFDHKIHVANGYTQYENFPGWDMYRSLIGLIALLQPHEVSDMIQSLIADARQGGGGLPRWQVANDNSGGMVGDSQDVVIATSYAFGARDFDTEAAFAAMHAGASVPGTLSGHYEVRPGLSDYLSNGYVSTTTLPYGSAAITLEYAVDDFALAQFAKALGKMDAYHIYLKRSANWQHLFHNGYIVPRDANGTFMRGFSATSDLGFVEGDAADYTWMVPQNLPGLFNAMGGKAEAIARLDEHFLELNAGSSSIYAYMGNEPEFEVPWEYDAAGVPYRTQDVVRRIEMQLFTATPGGLPGNDDGGATSSWFVFAALGLYPEVPGVAGFAVGSPLFPSATVYLGNGHQLQILGQGAGVILDNSPFVQSLSLNGQTFNSAWIPFDLLSQGAILQFMLGSNPNTSWGTQTTFG